MSFLKSSITGTGVVCPAGDSPQSLWQSVIDGRVPAERLSFSVSNGRRIEAIACPCPEPVLRDSDRRVVAKSDRITRLALAAARSAWESADLHHRDISPARIAIIAGTSRGPSERWNEAFIRLHEGRPMLPTLTTTSTVASLSGAISLALGTRGPSLTVSATCASAAHAIATGAAFLESDLADIVLAGGSDAPLNAFVIEQMRAAGLLADHSDPKLACRPFHPDRNGLVPGDGAAFLVMERSDTDQTPLAFLKGFAIGTSDTGKAGVGEDGAALGNIVQQALSNAAISASDVDFINAHGTGTPANDAAEEAAYASVLPHTPFASTKAFTGHCLGATPAIEAVYCIEQLRRQKEAKIALSTSVGFWGQLAALLIGRA